MEDIISKFNLPSYIKGKSFAEASKIINKRSGDRTDVESVETKRELLDRLKQAQEFVKSQEQEQKQKNGNKNDTTNNEEQERTKKCQHIYSKMKILKIDRESGTCTHVYGGQLNKYTPQIQPSTIFRIDTLFDW